MTKFYLVTLFSFCVLAMGLTLSPPVRADDSTRLKVSNNGRFLIHADGRPFFYLGDTAWELFHRLNREETQQYLRNRADKDFTVIQAVIVSEISGLTIGNAYGEKPFVDMDVSRPNEKYFAHVDWTVNKAASMGLYVGMLPTWGRWVGGNDAGRDYNDFFNETNARAYGKYLGDRYLGKPVIWILGGDRDSTTSRGVWNEMAAGLRTSVGASQLISYHPRTATSPELHTADWLDFNMIQSGHSTRSTNYLAINRDYALQPAKPCLDAEPAYEYPPDAMPDNRPVGEIEVRRNAYWAVFAGAHGHTYGAHPIWQMYDKGRKPRWDVRTPWHQSLDLPGAGQLQHLKRLMFRRPFLSRIPDQSVIESDLPGGLAHIQATRDGRVGVKDATYIMVYFPKHHRATINTGMIAGEQLRNWWFNPRTGESTSAGEMPNADTMEFEPPTKNAGEDWVLVIDDASKGYEAQTLPLQSSPLKK